MYRILAEQPGCDQRASDASYRLSQRFPTLKGVFYATQKELLSVEGVTEQMAHRIYTIRLLAQKGELPPVSPKHQKISGPQPE